MEAQLRESKKKLTISETKLTDAVHRENELKEQVALSYVTIARLQAEVSKYKTKSEELELDLSERRQVQDLLDSLKEKLKGLEEVNARMEKEVMEAQTRIKETEEELEAAGVTNHELKAKVKYYKEKDVGRNQEKEKMELKLMNCREKLSTAKSKLKSIKQELTATRCSSNKVQPGQLEKKLDQMTHENLKQQEELKAFSRKLAKVRSQKTELENKLVTVIKDKRQLEALLKVKKNSEERVSKCQASTFCKFFPYILFVHSLQEFV